MIVNYYEYFNCNQVKMRKSKDKDRRVKYLLLNKFIWFLSLDSKSLYGKGCMYIKMKIIIFR